jgi:anaphase-promoting complex subunit 3
LFRFFQRAVQVDSRFAYAYTLLGHEYVLVEELEKALSCFRTAVRHAGETISDICGSS